MSGAKAWPLLAGRPSAGKKKSVAKERFTEGDERTGWVVPSLL